MNTMRRSGGGWSPYIATDYEFTGFPRGARVLDVGFGRGHQMREVARGGGRPFGVEYNRALAAEGRRAGLQVCQGSCEQLPIATASMDGLVCKVVILLTDEAKSIAEIARVMKPQAIAYVSYHGLGYSLRYLFTPPNWKLRVYALRTIVNTVVYRLTGRRLPGFLGDTLFQTSRRLRRYYRQVGLELVHEHPGRRFAGAPVFIYHTLRRTQ